jgi:hypothetical protein
LGVQTLPLAIGAAIDPHRLLWPYDLEGTVDPDPSQREGFVLLLLYLPCLGFVFYSEWRGGGDSLEME